MQSAAWAELYGAMGWLQPSSPALHSQGPVWIKSLLGSAWRCPSQHHGVNASSPPILGGKLRALTALELQDRGARCRAHFLHAWRRRDNGLPVKADPVLTMARVHNLSSLQQCLVNTGACSPLPVPFVGVIYCSSVPLCPLKFITAFTQLSKSP